MRAMAIACVCVAQHTLADSSRDAEGEEAGDAEAEETGDAKMEVVGAEGRSSPCLTALAAVRRKACPKQIWEGVQEGEGDPHSSASPVPVTSHEQAGEAVVQDRYAAVVLAV